MLTGRWQLYYDDKCKCFIELGGGKSIWFRDTRGFGYFKFTNDENILTNKINKLGPDIMTREFTLPVFEKLIKNYSKRNVTSFLMDQSIISGCGNYIKAEVLFYSKISPLRKCSTFTVNEIELLYEALRVISRISYNNKGLTLKDYADENGNKSKNILKIYGKKDACRTKTADGRITYWNPIIQS